MADTLPMRSAMPAEVDLGVGKRTRLQRLLHGYGASNGTLLLLSLDHGLEHGPMEFLTHPESADPRFGLRLAQEAHLSGIVLQIGIAERAMRDFAGRVPLILKLNGKTSLPPDDEALSSLTATVEDAVRLGADGVGYTIHVGSPAQFEDFTQFSQVRQDCGHFGMPLIVWGDPRGSAIERKGGRESLFAIEYAARVATELGADIVVLAAPASNSQKDAQAPKPYNSLQVSEEEALRRVVAAAVSTPVLITLDGPATTEDLLRKARQAREAGAAGLLCGWSLWGRPSEEALALAGQLWDLLKT